MTINKDEGQTIPHIGIYLPNLVFSHGQLYVAMSWATTRSNLKVLAATAEYQSTESDGRSNFKVLAATTEYQSIESDDTFMKNIVYKEVLTS
jgi:ATP-dependent DNA helicase PIF1